MATITGFLSSAKTKARVEITAEQSSNLIPLADDLYKTLKDAGWQMTQEGVNQFIGFSAPGKRFAGAVVTIKGEPLKPDEKVFFSPDEPMAYVGKVLESLGIPSILRREQSHAEDLISVEFEGTLNQSNQP